MWCPAVQVRGPRAGLRPEAGPRPHVRRQLALGDRPAARALLGLRHVLGHLRRRRRLDIGDLMPALRRHRLGGQVRAAPAAIRRRELQPVIGVIHQAHRRPRIARLLARPPLPPLPQRPVPALLLIRAVRRRGPRRRGRIPARPAPEVVNLSRQPLNLRRQLPDHPVRLSQPGRQLSSRQSRKLLHRGNTRHIGHSRQ